MKSLRLNAGIIEYIYLMCNLKDKKLINMLSLMIPVSAIIAGGSFFFLIKFFTGSSVIGIVIGLITFLCFLWHDQSLMSTNKMNQIYGRIIASLALAIFITIPFKADQMEEVLIERIKQQTERENANLQMEMIQEIGLIEQESQEIDQQVVKASELWPERKQPLHDARRAQTAFQETKAQRIEDIKNAYAGLMKKPEIAKFDILGHYANNMFSPSSPSELFLNMIIIIALLFLEASPAILRLAIEKGEYIDHRNHMDDLKKNVDDKIMASEIRIIDGDEDMAKHIIEIEIAKEKKNLIDNQFKDLTRLMELYHMLKMLNQGNNAKMTESEEKSKFKSEEKEEEIPEWEFNN